MIIKSVCFIKKIVNGSFCITVIILSVDDDYCKKGCVNNVLLEILFDYLTFVCQNDKRPRGGGDTKIHAYICIYEIIIIFDGIPSSSHM